MRGPTLWRNSRLNEHFVYYFIGLSNDKKKTKTQTSLPPWCLQCCTTDCLCLHLARLMCLNLRGLIQVEGAAQSSEEAALEKLHPHLATVGNLEPMLEIYYQCSFYRMKPIAVFCLCQTLLTRVTVSQTSAQKYRGQTAPPVKCCSGL